MSEKPVYQSRHSVLNHNARIRQAAIAFLGRQGVFCTWSAQDNALLHSRRISKSLATLFSGFLRGLSWADYGIEDENEDEGKEV